MTKHNILIRIIQTLLPEKEVDKVSEKNGYDKKARKFTVMSLVIFFIVAALEKTKSYRETVCLMKKYGMPQVHYSEVSKKAKEVPYELTKDLYEEVLSQCDRKFRRRINKICGIEKKIQAIDSTTITTSKTQLKWAGFHGQRSGIKLHVRLDTETFVPTKIEESIARSHDSNYADELTDHESVLVEDRAYGKIERFDKYDNDAEKQLFVIRIKENITIVQGRKLRRLKNEDSNIVEDESCYLGKNKKRSKNRFRVVRFMDENKKILKVCTNIMDVPAETIAEVYKQRWTIEVFFRFVKQNLNMSRIFGTSKNAVFTQLYAGMIAFIIIKMLHEKSSRVMKFTKLSLGEFIRCVRFETFSKELFVFLSNLWFC